MPKVSPSLFGFIQNLFNPLRAVRAARKKAKMEVTIENFDAVLPLVLKSIDEAEFVAMDGEFTGLSLGQAETGQMSMDTAEQRYSKVRATTSKFLLVQFGLCTFHRDKKSGSYYNRGFNFYVWPRPLNRSYPDARFLCQTSSIDFLVQQDFDFNKLFRKGIPYLKRPEFNRMKDVLMEKQQARKMAQQGLVVGATPSPGNKGPIICPEEQREFIDQIMKSIEDFKKGDGQEPLELPRCNAFQRRLVYETVRARFGVESDIYIETTIRNKDRILVVSKVNEEERQRLSKAKDETELQDLENSIGFSKVIDRISQSRKLVVGHNMLLDLCHTVNQFVCPLPESLDDFKDLMLDTFPNVCDTKLMATTSPFKESIANSTLEDLVKILDDKPFRMPEVKCPADHPGYSLKDSQEKYHEAGYDAFITGLCFISMANRLTDIRRDAAGAGGDAKEHNIDAEFHLLQPYLNKICLRIPDIPYLNLAGDDVVPCRDNVFHVTFPAEWKTSDLHQLFYTFGPVGVSWVSDTSAYVSLKERIEDPKVVMSSLNCSSVYCIMPYDQHKKLETSLQLSTGMTPTMEKTRISFSMPPPSNGTPRTGQAIKRPVSPTQEDGLKKRNKSASDDCKAFEEPPWE